MSYPTYQEVDNATHVQLARWYRFLPSPGTSGMNKPQAQFQEILEREKKIMDHIIDRFNGMGGMTSEISKRIGWDK